MKHIDKALRLLKRLFEVFYIKSSRWYFFIVAIPLMWFCGSMSYQVYKWDVGLMAFVHSTAIHVSAVIPGVVIGYIISWLLRIPLAPKKWDGTITGLAISKDENAFTIPLVNEGPLILNNIFNGVMIVGQPGSGKTASAIHPLIYQVVQKDWTGLIYDLKGKLGDEVMTAYNLIENKSARRVNLKFINFGNPLKSQRVNPINPEYIQNKAEVLEFVGTLLSNLMASDGNKSEDPFWFNNAKNILSSIIWFLKKEHPANCTIPHAIALAFWGDPEELINLLQSDPECSRMLATLNASSQSKDQKLFINILSTLYTHLLALDLPELFYILTGNEINLNVSSPKNPTLLTIANHEPLQRVYSPIVAVICNVVTQRMNEDGKCKGAIILDEFGSIKIPNFERTPETIRSRNVATVLALQDKQQLITKYGDSVAETIASTLATKFYFKSTNSKTVEEAVKIFGKRDVHYKTRTESALPFFVSMISNISGPTLSDNIQERDYLKIEEITNYERGQFAGIYSDASIKYSKGSFATLVQLKNRSSVKERQDVDSTVISKAYHQVYIDINSIFENAKQERRMSRGDVKIDFNSTEVSN